MGTVRTPILGRPRPLTRERHASARYTLVWEEPRNSTRQPSSNRVVAEGQYLNPSSSGLSSGPSFPALMSACHASYFAGVTGTDESC